MFEFATAGRIIFGRGTLKELAQIAPTFGRRAVVVTGRNIDRAAPVLQLLRKAGVEAATVSAAGEPQISTIQQGVERAREFGTEFVIGFGGGRRLTPRKRLAHCSHIPRTFSTISKSSEKPSR
jgi:alcohol dehydrogenase class IV